jgi:hypothetical protein
MSETWGANPEQLRDFAQQCGTGAQTLTGISAVVTAVINDPSRWQGNDADRMRDRWNSGMRMQIFAATSTLERVSLELLEHAAEQEQASSDGGGGGIPGVSATGPGGSAASAAAAAGFGAAFRNGWSVYGRTKALAGLAKNLYQVGWMGVNHPEAFRNAALWRQMAGKLPALSAPYNLMDSAGDLLGLRNLQKYFPQLGKMSSIFAEEAWLFKGTQAEWLGKGGLGRGLGWLGVGLNAYDTVDAIADGDTGKALASGAKTVLGVACFLPPPAGTAAQIASAAWAVYDIPVVKDFVHDVGSAVGSGVSNAVSETGEFVEDVGDGIKDLGKGAAKFLGFG